MLTPEQMDYLRSMRFNAYYGDLSISSDAIVAHIEAQQERIAELEHALASAVEAEREACAKVCDPQPGIKYSQNSHSARQQCAAAPQPTQHHAQVPDGWQPIESAPKDGTEIDLWAADIDPRFGASRVTDARWSATRNEWVYDSVDGDPVGFNGTYIVTHWRPIPDAPQPKGGER